MTSTDSLHRNISFGIVTHNNEKEILSLLSSLISCDIAQSNIYIADNASKDKTVEIIKNKFKNIHLIKSNKNLGFGTAHNRIIDCVNTKYHLIVNPDIFLEKEQIEKMIDYMNNNPDVCILSPKILNTDGTEQFLPKRNPSFKYLFGGKLTKKIRDKYTMKYELADKPQEIDFCTGCFMFCRTKALKACSGFDERFFLYLEDADLTRRMKKYGKTMYVPFVFVTHSWQRASSKNLKASFQHLHSACKYFTKWKQK